MIEKPQGCPDVAVIYKSKEIYSTADHGPYHTYFIIKAPTVTVKCGTETEALFLCFNLCQSD